MKTRNYFVAVVAGILMLLSAQSYAAWPVIEDFEGSTDGVRCPTFWKGPANSTVTSEQNSSSGGNKSCKFSVQKGGTAWGGGFLFPTRLKQLDQVWVRFRLFIPVGFDFNAYSDGNRVKFIRMAEDNNNGDAPYLDWYWQQEGSGFPYGAILERDQCTNNCWQYFGTGDGPLRGTWETYEEYVKFDHDTIAEGGEARFITWKNGKLLRNMTSRPTMWKGQGGMRDSEDIISTLIFSYWNGGSPKTQFLYFDDLVATNIAPGSTCDDGDDGLVPCIGVGDFVYVAPPGIPTSVDSPAAIP